MKKKAEKMKFFKLTSKNGYKKGNFLSTFLQGSEFNRVECVLKLRVLGKMNKM